MPYKCGHFHQDDATMYLGVGAVRAMMGMSGGLKDASRDLSRAARTTETKLRQGGAGTFGGGKKIFSWMGFGKKT
jgi:hypothetical protein